MEKEWNHLCTDVLYADAYAYAYKYAEGMDYLGELRQAQYM